MSFYGFSSKPDLPFDGKIVRTAFSTCTPGKKCRGSTPRHKLDGTTYWGYLYWDGSEDDGVVVTKCVTVFRNDTYAWFE